jgi:hypothetical protein
MTLVGQNEPSRRQTERPAMGILQLIYSPRRCHLSPSPHRGSPEFHLVPFGRTKGRDSSNTAHDFGASPSRILQDNTSDRLGTQQA